MTDDRSASDASARPRPMAGTPQAAEGGVPEWMTVASAAGRPAPPNPTPAGPTPAGPTPANPTPAGPTPADPPAADAPPAAHPAPTIAEVKAAEAATGIPADQIAGMASADAPPPIRALRDFDNAQMGAVAHLYRGEVYRSTVWRTRLDNTTNWSIVMMGVALTTAFSSHEAPAMPLLVVGMLLLVFLVFEARRYRYFNVWRARARWMETHLFVPILRGQTVDPAWRDVLAADYETPVHHIGFMRALGRRLRRNYIWILGIQSAAYWGKLAIHPFPAQDLNDLVGRAAIGPVPGRVVLVAGLLYNAMWIAVAVWSWLGDRAKHGPDGGASSMG